MTVALEIKRRAIEEINNGKSFKDVASMFAADTSTVRSWKHKILKYFEEQKFCGDLKGLRFKMHQGNNVFLDEALFTWFSRQRSKGTPISGSLLKARTKLLNK